MRSDDDFGTPRNAAGTPFLRPCAAALASAWITFAATSALRAASVLDDVAPGAASQDRASPAPDVYVDESFESRDAMRRTDALARAGRWEEAAALLQETVDHNGDRLASVGADEFVSVRSQAMRRLAGWSPAGIAAWRRAFERPAAEALPAGLRNVSLGDALRAWEQYFVSVAAGERTDELAQRAMESGRFALATRIYETALTLHPDRRKFESTWRANLALTLAMSGDAPEARRLFEMGGEGLATTVRWMGLDLTASETLAQIETSFANAGAGVTQGDQPITVADVMLDVRGGCVVDEPGLAWRRGNEKEGEPASVPGDEPTAPQVSMMERARLLTLQPIVAGELVIAQRGMNVMAFQLHGGAPLWSTLGGPAGASLDVADSPSVPEVPAFEDGRIYAAATGPGAADNALDASEPISVLFCVSAADGRTVWRRTAPQYGDDHVGVLFDPAVLARRDHLFVVGRKRRAFGFEDCYLYCVRADNGELVFRTHLGSASTGSFGYRRTTYSLPSASGDLVFVCTSLGTIAAVQEDTGGVAWLRTYPQSLGRGRLGRPGDADTPPWSFTPPLFWMDRLAALPPDGDDLLILDQATGRIERRIGRETLNGAETLVGIRDGVVVVAGESVMAYDLAKDAPAWSARLPSESTVFGRGVVLDDRVMIPTMGHLCSLRMADGARTDRQWDVEGEGGNLIPLADMLIVAGERHLSAYLPRETIWNQLRRRLEESPKDVGAALEFAEVALRDHEYEEATQGLEEAYRRAEDQTHPIEADARQRFFQTTMTFAERLSSLGMLTAARRERLFTFASQFPPDAASNVALRLRFAEWFEADKDTTRAVRLLQQILTDRSLREVVIRSEGPRAPTASETAERRIDELIELHGRDVYAPFEEQARRQHQAASATRDTAQLLAVADTFPNSATAPQALVAGAELMEQAGQALRAAQTYVRAYYRYPLAGDRADLIRRIADAFERAGRRSQAYGWLTKAMREFPGVLFDSGGRRVTFAEYRERLNDARRAIEARRPAIDLPLRQARDIRFDEEPLILYPWFTGHPKHTFTRLYIYTAGTVQALDPRSGTSAWEAPRIIPERPSVLLSSEETTILATPHQVFAVDAQGRASWTFGQPLPGQNDPNRDWEGAPMFKGFAMREAEMATLRDDGWLTCLRLKDGAEVWRRRLEGAPGRMMLSTDDWIACTTSDGSRSNLTIMAWEPSREPWIIPLDDLGPVTRMLTTFDGQILAASTDRVAALDPESGRVRWSVAPGGRVRETMLVADLDGVCLSVDGRTVSKLSLMDGRELWRSTPLSARTDEGMSLETQDGNVLVSDVRSVYALDGRSGQLLWKGTTAPRPNLAFRGVTQAYFFAIDVRADAESNPPQAYFYDHRNASGVLPRDGGALALPGVSEVTAVCVLDHAMVVQSGGILRFWVDGAAPPSTP